MYEVCALIYLFGLGSDMSLREKSSIREILIILPTLRNSARNAMLSCSTKTHKFKHKHTLLLFVRWYW